MIIVESTFAQNAPFSHRRSQFNAPIIQWHRHNSLIYAPITLGTICHFTPPQEEMSHALATMRVQEDPAKIKNVSESRNPLLARRRSQRLINNFLCLCSNFPIMCGLVFVEGILDFRKIVLYRWPCVLEYCNEYYLDLMSRDTVHSSVSRLDVLIVQSCINTSLCKLHGTKNTL